MMTHTCISSAGLGEGCEDCRIRQTGHCDEFLVLLKQKCAYSEAISTQDREDIIGEFVLRIQTSIDKYEGRNGAQFKTWASSIFYHARADFFRKSQCHESADDFPAVSESPEKSIEFRNMTETLIRLIKEDATGCCKLFSDYYQWLRQGLKQKEMAACYGIPANTFTQRLRRCRSVIRTFLGATES